MGNYGGGGERYYCTPYDFSAEAPAVKNLRRLDTFKSTRHGAVLNVNTHVKEATDFFFALKVNKPPLFMCTQLLYLLKQKEHSFTSNPELN